MDSYILKNITQRDINLGDLRFKIPAGKCRNLLAKKSHVNLEEIIESETNGSISKFLGKALIKVEKIIYVETPAMEMADPHIVNFPQRKKSSIIIEVGDIDDELRELVLNEDDEYLKQLESEAQLLEEGGLPLVAKDGESKE